MFFKDWQLKVLTYLWNIQSSGANSREVWSTLQNTMGEPISRASVINFLTDMAEKGVLNEEKKSGKGGYHGIYSHKYSESKFKQYLADHFIRKLLNEFPNETRNVINASLL
jgi:predicted transcriptional regulator